MALSKEVKPDIALALYAIIKSLQAEVSHTEAKHFLWTHETMFPRATSQGSLKLPKNQPLMACTGQ